MKISNVLVLVLLLGAMSASGEIAVEDYLGRTVTLEKPAKRIIALAPHMVENTYSAGAGDYLVGAVEYSDYPTQAQKLPRVGGYNTYSLEAILALSPDLVITWVSGNGAQVIEQLSRLGIPVYADEPKTLVDIAHSIRDIGRLAGTEEKSESAADNFLVRLEALRTRNTDAPELKVFYQVWNQPLQTVNGEHIISDVLKVCGATNSFADALSLAPKINIEAVLERNPDVILASGMGQDRPPWLDDWRDFPSLKAVQNDHLFFVEADYIQRHTTRMMEGTERICKMLRQTR